MKKETKFKVKRPIIMRLMLWIGVPLLIVYMTVLILNYIWGKNAALKQTKEYLIELTSHHAAELNSQFIQISEAPISIAEVLQTFKKPTSEELCSLVSKKMENNPNIFGMAVAFEPYWFSKYEKFFSPYICIVNENFEISDLADSYNYLTKDWYSIPKLLDRSYWTEPYFDVGGGNILMCTFSTPIHSEGKFIGIATADISLEDLKSHMRNVRIMAGYTFIISRNGTFIYHPNKEYIMCESIFSLAEEYNFPYMREFGKDMIKGNQGVVAFNDLITGAKKWLVYTSIPSCQWSFAAVIPEEDVLASVNVLIMRQSSIMFIGLLIIILVIMWATIGITNPIRKLVRFAQKLATGNLDVQMENIKGKDEIQELAQVFNKMVVDLKQHIKDLTAATKAKESVESELRIARQIQESLLPRVFPPFPERKEFDLYAKNIPAKDVAGDFYDFFFIDEYKLVIIIADVSGKGVSAGLFMAVTRTLLKIVCEKGVGPAEALEKANIVLCKDNDACMFTTLFIAIYDVKSGKFQYTNAGHNPPIILSKDGSYRFLKSFNDMALGIDETHKFEEGKINLDVGSSLILYTDGVTEATSPDNNLYGEEKFINILTSNVSSSIESMMEKIEQDLQSFQEGQQFDDITMLFLRRNL